jgi:hypothetical protein
MNTVKGWLWAAVDRAEYLVTLARLSLLDWLAPLPETPVDRAIREEGERLRRAFPGLFPDDRPPLRRVFPNKKQNGAGRERRRAE